MYYAIYYNGGLKMKTIKQFLEELLRDIGVNISIDKNDIDVAKIFLNRINQYLYQSNNNEYISPFHEYWKEKHQEILNISINRNQARKIAEIFEQIFSSPSSFPQLELNTKITNTKGLSKENIANVRFYTAIQDFKINIYKDGRNPFQKYLEKPEWFEPEKIVESPNIILEFLEYLGATGSQGDKRIKWMLEASKFLLETCNGQAYNLLEICNNDLELVRKLISDERDIGFSRKKADMFIRDMLDWNIWDTDIGIEKLNVASDTNTIRVALRTGLLELDFPLLASYLDVYCYQYGLVDYKTQEGWRTVWEEWKKIPNNHCPKTPASMDYLIYKSIGKKYCKLNKRKCEECVLNQVCPPDKRNLKPPRSISIYGQTGWESGKTDAGGGGGIMS
ncbi:hypothetical protein PthBH41_24630 [Parageobacillus thermoglucosidasius]|nr:hypothetical protein PthBH41_24630 [Parageobacillus thermoglucosidasius]GAJ41986.1 hypothetical protein GT2_01_01250 [Parageobacillus thermoglucosidasius NBRC 107763]